MTLNFFYITENTENYYYCFHIFKQIGILKNSYPYFFDNFENYDIDFISTKYAKNDSIINSYSFFLNGYFSNNLFLEYNNDIFYYFRNIYTKYFIAYDYSEDLVPYGTNIGKEFIESFDLNRYYPVSNFFWINYFSENLLNYNKQLIFYSDCFYPVLNSYGLDYNKQFHLLSKLGIHWIMFAVGLVPNPKTYWFYSDLLRHIPESKYNNYTINIQFLIKNSYIVPHKYKIENGLYFHLLNDVFFNFVESENYDISTYEEYVFEYLKKKFSFDEPTLIDNFFLNDFLNIHAINFQNIYQKPIFHDSRLNFSDAYFLKKIKFDYEKHYIFSNYLMTTNLEYSYVKVCQTNFENFTSY